MTKFMPGYRLHAAARRASLMIETAPPMAMPLPTLAQAPEVATFYDRTMPRTQREAGIEYLGWEDRLAPPLEPVWKSWLAGLLTLAAIAIAWVVL